MEQPLTAKQKDRSVGLLIRLLHLSRWVLVFLLFAVPLTAMGAPPFPLEIHAGQPQGEPLRVYFGTAFEEGMNVAAVYVETIAVLMVVVFGIYATGQMLGVLRNVRAGNSFVRDNGARLRRIGYAGIALQLSIYALWVVAFLLKWTGALAMEGLKIDVTLGPWIGILMAFALATVFHDGANLKEEQDLTV